MLNAAVFERETRFSEIVSFASRRSSDRVKSINSICGGKNFKRKRTGEHIIMNIRFSRVRDFFCDCSNRDSVRSGLAQNIHRQT